MRSMVRQAALCAFALVAAMLGVSGSFGQSKSRITGTVTDTQTGEPLIGANVQILTTNLGAVTDARGKYFIVGVPVGTYRLQGSMMGYTKKVVSGIVVSADRLAEVNLALSPGEISLDAVEVTATRDNLNKEVTNTQMVATQDQIVEAAGIREINAFLYRQPGVSQENGYLTIRGGAADQTGTMVNGLSYNNPAVGNAETSIPLSAIEQVSVLSGGFNAEYGNFRSGLINVTTKSGSKSAYHGTLNFSRNFDQMRRFGPALNDPKAPLLAPYLDADVAFVGTEVGWASDPYRRQQGDSFEGWIQKAEQYNIGKPPTQQATPLDLYLLYSWLFMANPDYEGLARQGYTVSEEQKTLLEEHARSETGDEYNFDGGFGGPIPLLNDVLGATFYVSNNTTERKYVLPVVRDSERRINTLATIRLEPTETMTLTLNGLWKIQEGVSSIRPAFGDFPDATRDGGFMPTENYRAFVRDTRSSEYRMYWFDPPHFPLLKQTTLLGGITLNSVVSKSTYWELSLSTMEIQNNNPQHGDDRDTTKVYTYFGPFPVDEMPYGKWQFAGSHRLNGYTYASYDDPVGIGKFRFRGKEGDLYDDTRIRQFRAKFDIASQLDESHYLKAGFEYNYMDINHTFWEKWNNNAYNAYEFNYHRWPSQMGVYLQDQIAFGGFLANVGVRVDYYNGGGGRWPSGDPFATAVLTPVPYGSDSLLFAYLASGKSYIWDTWNEYDKANPGFLQPVENFVTVSPRVGVSFPITDFSKLYFNYGQFRSNPAYYSMYLLRYRYTKNGLYDMSNPNLEPPLTISYELGAVYNFWGPHTVRVAGYYKDVSGQPGDVTYANAAGTINYDAYLNNEYQDVQGLELSLTKLDASWITWTINFDYRLSKSGLTGRETITDVTINDDLAGLYAGQESRQLPQPSVNLSLTLRSPDGGDDFVSRQLLGGWLLTIFGEWRSGSYFTWNPLGLPYVSSNLQWPDYYMVDLRINKAFDIGGVRTTFYVDIRNLFNLEVNLMKNWWAFDRLNGDDRNYLASLRLPMYSDPAYDNLRAANPGFYLPGDDRPGDLRSAEKPYINDPNLPYFLYGQPRDIWLGLKVDF